MMKKIIYCAVFGLLHAGGIQAQAPGSSTYIANFNIAAGSTTEEYSETLIFGPGVNVIDGAYRVYSKNIVFHPDAQFSGTGLIEIYNSNELPGVPGAITKIDGNNMTHPINVRVDVYNNQGIALTNINTGLAGEDANTSTIYLGNFLNLLVDGANVWLDSVVVGDLRLSPFNYYTIGGSFGPQRMIITNNSIMSHVVKEHDPNYTIPFVFPVGIKPGDITPARVTVHDNDVHVSVIDYTAAEPIINIKNEGMNRTWHIYGGSNPGAVLLNNDVSTNGTAYVDDQAFITRYMGSGQWSSSPTPDYVSAGTHENMTDIPANIPVSGSDNASWLTKTSDGASPLPVKIVSFDIIAEKCDVLLRWKVASEINLSHYEIERSIDGRDYSQTAIVRAEGSNRDYTYNDINPGNGTFFYRLKMADKDDRYEYSQVKTVRLSCDGPAISLYPNPTTDKVYVKGVKGGELIQLYAIDGRLLKTMQNTSGDLYLIDMEKYAAGSYTLIITDSNKQGESFKVIKK